MQTIRTRMPIRAKLLIENFERGEVHRDVEEERESRALHSEEQLKGIAMPGTTKKRMLELERKLDLEKKPEIEKETKTERHHSTSTGKLSEDKYGDFATDRLKKAEGSKHYHTSSNNGVQHNVRFSASVETGHRGTQGHYETHKVTHKETHKETNKEPHKEIHVRERVHSIKDEVDGKKKATVLIVSCLDLNPTPIDRALVETLAKTLQESAKKIFISDLNDSRGRRIYGDERQKIHEADLVIFHFRPAFYSLPSKLTEWLENVLVEKFAYDKDNGHTFNHGLLKGKRALLLVTLNDEEDAFDENSFLRDITYYLWPIQNGILRFVGLSVLSPHVVYGASRESSHAAIEEATLELKKRLGHLWREESIFETSYYHDDN